VRAVLVITILLQRAIMTPEAFFSVASSSFSSSSPSSPFDRHWSLYPRTYIAYRAPPSFTSDSLDGDLTKNVWKHVPWSDDFADIQGNDKNNDNGNDAYSYPPARTRFKALWDDTHLYIGAELHPSPQLATQAHFTQRNSPIYQKDSDFEVFIDAIGSTHQYKELEVNALNTVWNLLLDKPYRDGGVEHSGRVAQPGDPLYYEVTQQTTAVKIVNGTLNDRHHQGALWTVELALGYSDIYALSNNADNPSSIVPPSQPPLPPTPGSFWRINFSRVELQGKINWTWQKQQVWDPSLQQHVGKIDMHLPDAWGYLVFAGTQVPVVATTMVATTSRKTKVGSNQRDAHDDRSNKVAPYRDPSWPARLAAMNIYYAQHYYKEQHQSYSSTLEPLILDQAILKPFQVTVTLTNDDEGSGYLVEVMDPIHRLTVIGRHDRLLRLALHPVSSVD